MTSKRSMMRTDIISMWLVWLVVFTDGQISNECPRDWLDHSGHCYKFVLEPQLTFQDADFACRRQHSALLSVTSTGENNYVRKWLIDHDGKGPYKRRDWLTSGTKKGRKFVWTSDGSEIQNFYFVTDDMKDKPPVDKVTYHEYNLIVYRYEENELSYYWNWGRIMKPASYICKVSKQDVWKFYQAKRDFIFATRKADPLQWPVAPNITTQSGDTIFFRRMSGWVTPVALDCVAEGNPTPSYQWFRQIVGKNPVAINGDDHYTVSNGKLAIQKPDSSIDVAVFYCQASNQHGTVLSNPIQLSYGKLDEFPPVRTNDLTADMYRGIEIDCQPPDYKPAVTFNWFKEPTHKSIRPGLNPQFFLSRNGKLYISEVADSDAASYSCAVQLAARPGETLASGRPITRNSMNIRLVVKGDSVNRNNADIQDKFPMVFPEVPLIGQRLVIECLAYGRLPLVYDWVRGDAPMNPKAYKTDANRVLIIEEALLQDTGAYTCKVSGIESSVNRTRYIKLSGVPSFPIPLQNKFLDMNSPFTWSCYALGVPVPTYRWYKDGKALGAKDDKLGITVRGRHLMFEKITNQHNGAYECEATNSIGIRRSSAQLMAVEFKPSFSRNPLPTAVQATVGGKVTVPCKPDAAPRPVITWTRDNGALSGSSKILPDGSLELLELSTADTGTYGCEATNSMGSDKSSVILTVSDKTVLTATPNDVKVNKGGAISFPCKASFDETKTDIIYTWKFYDHVIDFQEDVAYSMPYSNKGIGDLYLVSAQYEHEGYYTCLVSSGTGAVSATGHLIVQGPPDPPAGVHKPKLDEPTSTAITIWWMPGRNHYHPITHYAVEAQSTEGETWTLVKRVTEEGSKIELMQAFRGAEVNEGLSPGISYRFRVMAGNIMGYSPPSDRSPSYKMNISAPIVTPSGLGGGGGKERELQITWKPLDRKDWGGDSLWYNLYFRKKENNGTDRKWEEVIQYSKTSYHTVVSKQNFYLPYEVRVQAENEYGPGPLTQIVDVMSAEMMPKIQPNYTGTNVENATAATVTWKRIPNKRKIVLGSLFAFQVNYWLEGADCKNLQNIKPMFTRVYGDVTQVRLVGLFPSGEYCVNLQVLNHAGLGPKTTPYNVGMNYPPPSEYPQYVTISSHGPDSVRVIWKGIVTKLGEVATLGYKAWYWKLQEDIRNAKEKDFGRAFTGVLTGIEKNEVYRLRILAYSNGGNGKKAPDVMFSLGGLVQYNVLTTDVMNFAPRPLPSMTIIMTFTLLLFTLV